MGLLNIDAELCIHDGLCVMACPASIITIRDDELPVLESGAETACITCGHCVAICPTVALSHVNIPAPDCTLIDPELDISVEQVGQFIKSRRSIRRYLPKNVSKETIEAILDVTRFAPSGHNDQNIAWRVYTQPEKLRRVSEATVEFFKYLASTEEGKTMPFDFNEIIAGFENGKDVILRGAPVLIAALGDQDNPMVSLGGSIYLTTLELVAKTYGLGTCWAGFVMVAAELGFQPLLDVLDLPEGTKFAGGLMMGYPALNYLRIPTRNKAKIYWD